LDISLSLVIPAFNEELRLLSFLETVRAYLDDRYAGRYEVIVVDDGSNDGTAELLAARGEDWPALRVLQHPANRGKGAAVRTGMLAAKGETALFADADGATPIEEEGRLAEAIRAGADVAVGSRLLAGDGVDRRRTFLRGLTGRLFATVARWWLGLSVRDTQCGFKMFHREAARELFSQGKESGYLFDLELLLLAKRHGYEVAEVAVNWSDVPGGHLSLRREFGNILLGLWRLRRRVGQGSS
jgi:dolichyl-phosphate beta-glucosyltransferase